MIFKTELEKDRTLFKTNFQTNIIAGNDGKSAYEIWLEQGNTGTEQDFLNSLKGEDGSSFDLTPLTEKIDQNTADIAEINTKINIEGKLPYPNIASACNAIYTNVGAMNGRIIALENQGGSNIADYITETGGGSDNWYRVWNSGFKEVGGATYYFELAGQIYFPYITFSNTDYYVSVSTCGTPSSYSFNPVWVNGKSEDSFFYHVDYELESNGQEQLIWYICGY